MAEIILDIQEGGARITLDRGWEIRRVITVHNLTGEGYAKIKTAYETTGMPQLMDEHPARPSAKLYELQPEIIDDTTIKFMALYCDYWYNWTFNPIQPPSMSLIQMGSSVTQMDTNRNFAGTVMYVPRSDKTSQGLTVSKFISEPTITITKIENVNPISKATFWVGKCNTTSANWGAARTWMCTGITGYSSDGGVTYEVTYNFIRRLPNWDDVGIWIDPETGRAPADITEGNGQKTWQLYESWDFDELGLI